MSIEQNSAAGIANRLQVKDIYNITERNYDWQSFKYQNPKKYQSPTLVQGVSGGLFGMKKGYLDDLEKQKKAIPAPNKYTTSIPNRPKSGKMDKKSRITLSEQIKLMNNKQNIPGPGAYFKRPKTAGSKPSLQKKASQFKEHYLNQVQYLAIVTPGVGQYNLTNSKHVATPQIIKSANKRRVEIKQQKQKTINTMENFPGTFQWLNRQQKKKNSNFFGSSKRFVNQSKYEKKPGPNSYKLNTDWSKDTNIMKTTASQPSLFSGSVYYK